MFSPHAGEAVGLQLDLHLDVVGCRLTAGRALGIFRSRQDAEQILHVMANFVRDYVSLRELTGFAAAAAKPRLDLVEERSVEIDLLVIGTIERPHCSLGRAATRLRDAAIHDQRRRAIGLAVL